MKEEMETISFFFLKMSRQKLKKYVKTTSDFSLVQQLEKSKGASFNLLIFP